ncbi:hypothetical protein E2C01_066007 [Portunus trituberculatus]|uniref:Uncharacterized protein n=1 Tax=Portunus trituberculatus TaxID=210409 RepID=A0A5B7HG27_PORTR|nr:hypothetical protein [Portunus trituberculatus]
MAGWRQHEPELINNASRKNPEGTLRYGILNVVVVAMVGDGEVIRVPWDDTWKNGLEALCHHHQYYHHHCL